MNEPEIPKILCRGCGKEKDRTLFSPSQRERNRRCMMCQSKRSKEIRGPKREKSGATWRNNPLQIERVEEQ